MCFTSQNKQKNNTDGGYKHLFKAMANIVQTKLVFTFFGLPNVYKIQCLVIIV